MGRFLITITLGLCFFRDFCRASRARSCLEASHYWEVKNVQYATLCKKGTASGPNVFIDTGLAAIATRKSGPVCKCTVQLQQGKAMVSELYYPFQREYNREGETCGTTVKFEYGSKQIFQHSDLPLCDWDPLNMVVPMGEHINMSFIRLREPYVSNYCVMLKLKYCQENEFQCDDGTCIENWGRCDNFPDCADSSDEQNCGSELTCLEGQLPCDDGTKCVNPTARCDGVTQCSDKSDESPKYCDPNYVEPEPEYKPPLIIVNCEESPYITTTTSTTTTTTTTTPTTTTTTPTTTTTTPTTTTTTPTTTTTTPTTTTTTPTTTTTTTPTTTTTTPTSTTTTPTTTTNTPTTTTTTPTTTTTTPTTTTTTTPTTTTTTPKTTTTPLKTTAISKSNNEANSFSDEKNLVWYVVGGILGGLVLIL